MMETTSCDHSGAKTFTYLGIFKLTELYMCECGVVVDTDDSTPLTAAQLEQHVKNEIAKVENVINDIRYVIGNFDQNG